HDETTDLITDVIDAETFYGFLDVYAATYLNYFTGKSDSLAFQYNLTEIKTRLVDNLTAKLLVKYSALPTCTSEQTRAWDIQKEFPNCQLPAGSVKAGSIETQLKTQVSGQVDQLPDEVNTTLTQGNNDSVRNVFKIANSAINIAWIATLLVLILLVVIWRRKSFVPIAIALLFVGLVQIGFSLVAWDWIAKNVADSLGQGAGELTPLALEVAGTVIELLKKTLANLTIIILGAGGALLVLGIIGAVRGNKITAAP
ncbi:MAG: hypothetical protein WEC83_01355, partial [Patescibacteria group bacterium]